MRNVSPEYFAESQLLLLRELFQAYLKQGISHIFVMVLPVFMWILPVLHDWQTEKFSDTQWEFQPTIDVFPLI